VFSVLSVVKIPDWIAAPLNPVPNVCRASDTRQTTAVVIPTISPLAASPFLGLTYPYTGKEDDPANEKF
jgi:hypothetical protein